MIYLRSDDTPCNSSGYSIGALSHLFFASSFGNSGVAQIDLDIAKALERGLRLFYMNTHLKNTTNSRPATTVKAFSCKVEDDCFAYRNEGNSADHYYDGHTVEFSNGMIKNVTVSSYQSSYFSWDVSSFGLVYASPEIAPSKQFEACFDGQYSFCIDLTPDDVANLILYPALKYNWTPEKASLSMSLGVFRFSVTQEGIFSLYDGEPEKQYAILSSLYPMVISKAESYLATQATFNQVTVDQMINDNVQKFFTDMCDLFKASCKQEFASSVLKNPDTTLANVVASAITLSSGKICNALSKVTS